MKKITLLSFLFLVIAVAGNNCVAQIVTKYGDNVSTLDGIMKAYYDVVTVKIGEKPSYERDSLLHYGNVQVGWAVKSKTGKKTFEYMSLKEYHRLTDDGAALKGLMKGKYRVRLKNLALFIMFGALTKAATLTQGR
jgi:hypothetical protein